MDHKHWYVIHSKPQKENQVNTFLQSQGIETFFPTLQITPVNPRSRKIRPYFSRYLFVRVNLDEVGASTLKWAPGVTRLVEFDGTPARVPDVIMAQLQQHLRTVMEIDQHDPPYLQPGDPVRIIKGPLAGYEAIFDLYLNGTKRAQVLLSMLGALTRTKVDTSVIEKKR